jgi:hypothetical protein
MRVFDEALVPVEGNRITVVQNHKDIKGLRESLESFRKVVRSSALQPIRRMGLVQLGSDGSRE